jgi:hypothetical protein
LRSGDIDKRDVADVRLPKGRINRDPTIVCSHADCGSTIIAGVLPTVACNVPEVSMLPSVRDAAKDTGYEIVFNDTGYGIEFKIPAMG